MINLDYKENKIITEQSVIDELLLDIRTNCRQTSLLTQQLERSLDAIRISTHDYINARRRVNPYIVKRVISHIANGINRQDAVIMTAEEFGETVKRVDVLFDQQKVYMSALNLFAKKYMAEKLKKAGYKVKDIAKIIGVSENHVYKLMRATNKFWELT